MRIVFGTLEYQPIVYGGLGTYSSEVAPRIARAGHEVHVMTMGAEGLGDERSDGLVVHRIRPFNATSSLSLIANDELRRWGPGLRYLNDVLIYNALAAAEALRMARDGVRLDVVHVHDWLSAAIGMALKDELGVPLVFHVHSTERGRNMGGGSSTVSSMELACAGKADAVVAVSGVLRDCDMAPQGFPTGKVHVIWNGVDPGKYDPGRVKPSDVAALRRSYGISDGEEGYMILFVGRLVREKGVDKLVESMKYVVREHPGAKLVVVGQGYMYQQLVDIAVRAGVQGNVVFVNRFMGEDEKILHYAASDVAVSPSIYEPFGIVALEAMSMAKPVVAGASGCSGLREIVVPSGAGQNGVHVDGRNPKDIAWGISAVLSSEGHGAAMGLNGRARVMEHFTWERTVERTLELYRSLAGR